MAPKTKVILRSLPAPGLGYLRNNDKKSFYRTLLLFFGLLGLGVGFRWVTSFWGLMAFFVSPAVVHLVTIVHAAREAANANRGRSGAKLLRGCFTLAFLLVTGLSFANRRPVMGFDVMRMDVPVMQPTILPGERFLIDTWLDKSRLGRGTIVVHSFEGQQGVYLNRIVAVGGDEIEISNGTVFINHQPLFEPYVLNGNKRATQSKQMYTTTVARDHYFVMGDNRDASFGDSRFSGTIAKDNIIGRPTDIISSNYFSRIGKHLN